MGSPFPFVTLEKENISKKNRIKLPLVTSRGAVEKHKAQETQLTLALH